MRKGIRAGFTLVELVAAVALLGVLMAILWVVFGSASKVVTGSRAQLQRNRTLRAVILLLEQNLPQAFMMKQGTETYGFLGEDGADPAFLEGLYTNGTPVQDSDRLSIIRLRHMHDPSAGVPGFEEICFLRCTHFPDPTMLGDRRNFLYRIRDEDMGVWVPGWTAQAPPGEHRPPFPPGFLAFSVPDPTDTSHAQYYRNYILGWDISDIQFNYMSASTGEWTSDGDWTESELPAVVKVTLRFGPSSSRNDRDHETFVHLIYLPTAP